MDNNRLPTTCHHRVSTLTSKAQSSGKLVACAGDTKMESPVPAFDWRLLSLRTVAFVQCCVCAILLLGSFSDNKSKCWGWRIGIWEASNYIDAWKVYAGWISKFWMDLVSFLVCNHNMFLFLLFWFWLLSSFCCIGIVFGFAACVLLVLWLQLRLWRFQTWLFGEKSEWKESTRLRLESLKCASTGT